MRAVCLLPRPFLSSPPPRGTPLVVETLPSDAWTCNDCVAFDACTALCLPRYTPEHMHCYATFYGPVTPPNTGFVAFQNVISRGATFRIAATGTVLELDSSFKASTATSVAAAAVAAAAAAAVAVVTVAVVVVVVVALLLSISTLFTTTSLPCPPLHPGGQEIEAGGVPIQDLQEDRVHSWHVQLGAGGGQVHWGWCAHGVRGPWPDQEGGARGAPRQLPRHL